ncbi:X-box-binding protein 1-like [Acropora muricata]|uniref:X-box-binding protein 1-like n=1 Tax=Acropora muricata TaxID=159855 RepID=UPI0034E47D57
MMKYPSKFRFQLVSNLKRKEVERVVERETKCREGWLWKKMESKTVDREAVINSLVLNNSTTDGQPRKRKRLDNLSAEERALRRKLKNRVAAQTARDRKKARMVELEEMVAQLEKENKALRLDNESLRKHTEAVDIENSELRARLGLTPPVSPEPVTHSFPPAPEVATNCKANSPVVIKTEAESIEYASLSVSQQQERLILFLSLITMWMTINNRLTWIWALLQLMTQKNPSFISNKKTTRARAVANMAPSGSPQTGPVTQMKRQCHNPAAVT